MNYFIAELSIVWTVIKTTFAGKIAAIAILLSPLIVVVSYAFNSNSILPWASTIATVLGGVFAILKKQKELHITMNSRLDQLLIATKAASYSAGVKSEVDRRAKMDASLASGEQHEKDKTL